MHIKQMHITVTQPNLLKEHVSQTHGLTEKIDNEMPTHDIANKGLRGMRKFVPNINFSCNLTGNRPKSLTGHTAKY